MAKVVQHIQVDTMRVGFSTWAGKVHEEGRLRTAAERVAYRWTRVTVAGALTCWAERAQSERRVRRACLLLVKRWAMRSAGASFHTWALNVLDAGKMARMSAKVMSKWAHGTALEVLHEWRGCTRSRRRCRRIVLRFQAVRRTSAVSTVWEMWSDVSSRLARSHDTADSRISSMLLSATARAMLAWKGSTRRAIRIKKAGGKGLRAWLGKHVDQAFCAWHARAKNRSAGRRVSRRLAARLSSAKQSRCLHAWASGALTCRLMKRARARVAERRKMGVLCRAFAVFAERCAESSEMRVRMSRLVGRGTVMNLREAFFGWEARARLEGRAASLFRKAAWRFRGQTMESVLTEWKLQVKRDAGLRSLVIKVSARGNFEVAHGAFRAWERVHFDGKRLKKVSMRFLWIMKNRAAHSSFQRWKAQVKVCSRCPASCPSSEKKIIFLFSKKHFNVEFMCTAHCHPIVTFKRVAFLLPPACAMLLKSSATCA